MGTTSLLISSFMRRIVVFVRCGVLEFVRNRLLRQHTLVFCTRSELEHASALISEIKGRLGRLADGKIYGYGSEDRKDPLVYKAAYQMLSDLRIKPDFVEIYDDRPDMWINMTPNTNIYKVPRFDRKNNKHTRLIEYFKYIVMPLDLLKVGRSESCKNKI